VARYITPETLLDIRFGDRERPQWDIAVLCFRGRRGSAPLVEKLGARPVGSKTLYGLEDSADRPYVYEARLGAARIAIVAECLWGGPQTAILVEELACFGVRVVVGFGVAGSIVPELAKGTQIVAIAGTVTDGTSRAYTDLAEVPADRELSSLLAGVAESLNFAVVPVTIATVDALYRETADDVRRWCGGGAVAINMETAPLYAASAACGIKSVWLGHVSDSLASPQWDSWVRPLAFTDVSVALAVGLLESLAGGSVGREA
jgi:purine-nucleoside phosphorylase